MSQPSPSSRRRAGHRIGAALVSTCLALPAAASEPSLSMRVEEGEHILFRHAAEACETWDIPDTPTRAFRGADGQVHVMQSHYRGRWLAGPDLFSLRHGCAVAFEGAGSADPASFDNQSWIGATYSPDGRGVFALVHNEYHGERFGAPCRKGEESACWYNSLTGAVSQDGGLHFQPTQPRLIAALPFRAEETRGHHAGYFEPTNIIAWNGAFYAMANVVAPKPQRSGNCLLRTPTLEDPSAWRVWRGSAFDTALADPYAGPIQPERHLCDPVAPDVLRWPVTSLTWHEASGTFIATMRGRAKGADGRERTGVYVATSPDLLHWAGPALLMEAPLFGSCDASDAISYPALIDPDSTDRNFGTVGDHPALTFVRADTDGCTVTPDRDIVLKRVRIDPTSASARRSSR
ncbi:hypothetical protein [Aureimonas sp. D3]|uniref:hypothetical protein n=1 Tax=Aureimonas sp. D3 TaxID=1638164 RepID=UPI0007844FD6|nr:hypothetical protein [Aureimonas sp. D3]